MPPTPEWPGATPRRKLEAGNCSPVWLPTPEAGSWKLDSRSQIRDKSQKTIVHRGQWLGGFIPELDRVFHLPELFQRWKLEDGKWRTKPSEAAAPPSVRKQQERPPPLLPSPKWQFCQVSATPAARRPWPPDVLALAAQRCGARVEFFAMLRIVLECCEGSGLRPWAIDL